MLWMLALLLFLIGSITSHVGKRKKKLSISLIGNTIEFTGWVLWAIGIFAYDHNVWMDILAIAWLLFLVIREAFTIEFSFKTKKSRGA